MEKTEKNMQKCGFPDKSLLRRYELYLRLEKSLSANTLDAYHKDLAKWLGFIEEEQLDFRNISLDELHRFAAILSEFGIQPRSLARILSGVRTWFRFLMLEREITADPTELLDSPNIGRKLPDVLAIEEIDSLIDSIDVSKPEGQRDRAIIETLYSCGLRVSELCNLHLKHFVKRAHQLR